MHEMNYWLPQAARRAAREHSHFSIYVGRSAAKRNREVMLAALQDEVSWWLVA